MYVFFYLSFSRTLHNYYVWTFIEQNSKYLSPKLDELKTGFLADIDLKDSSKKYCTDIVSSSMKYAIDYLYLKNYFSNSTKSKVKEMTSLIKAEFRTMILEAEWMDDKSKEKALDKVNNERKKN